MDRESYIGEVRGRLTKMFRASREGYRSAAVDRHRLEGFMQAGVFLGLVSHTELAFIMDEVHVNVFGQTLSERKSASPSAWANDEIDYSAYEQPAYERNNGK